MRIIVLAFGNCKYTATQARIPIKELEKMKIDTTDTTSNDNSSKYINDFKPMLSKK